MWFVMIEQFRFYPTIDGEYTGLKTVLLRAMPTPAMLSPVSQELEVWENISQISCQQYARLKSTNSVSWQVFRR